MKGESLNERFDQPCEIELTNAHYAQHFTQYSFEQLPPIIPLHITLLFHPRFTNC